MSVDPRLLPPVMRQLIAVIGMEATIRLLRARGGQRVHVPESRSKLLTDIVGAESARQLCERFGGQELDLPKYDKVAQQLRDVAIRAERPGASLNELAARHDLTRRHIQNILRDNESSDPDLFGLS